MKERAKPAKPTGGSFGTENARLSGGRDGGEVWVRMIIHVVIRGALGGASPYLAPLRGVCGKRNFPRTPALTRGFPSLDAPACRPGDNDRAHERVAILRGPYQCDFMQLISGGPVSLFRHLFDRRAFGPTCAIHFDALIGLGRLPNGGKEGQVVEGRPLV